MFYSLSWLDFLFGVAIVIGCVYVLALLLIFRKVIPHKSNANSLRQPLINQSPSSMMGPIKSDLKVNRINSNVNSNQVIIAAQELQEQVVDRDIQTGPSVSDLLQEIKAFTKIIQEGQVSESESLPMYKTLIQKNAHLESSAYKEVINNFLHDQCTNVCGFEIEISEIRSWWSDMQL